MVALWLVGGVALTAQRLKVESMVAAAATTPMPVALILGMAVARSLMNPPQSRLRALSVCLTIALPSKTLMSCTSGLKFRQ
jgi:hypothetical protein